MAQINKPTDYFNTVTWSGNSSIPRSITGVGFQPDFTWAKLRSAIGNHYTMDVVRGSGTGTLNTLNTDGAAAEQTNTSGGSTSFGVYTSFDSDGFTVNAGSSSAKNTNESGQTYVAWNWLGGGTGVSNTDGSITSTVSANTTSGFSIVTYTGNSSSSATVGHGLGVAPAMILNKCRTGANAAQAFFIYHKGLSANNMIAFNTNAEAGTGTYSSGILSTSPTSTTFGFTAGSSVINVNESSSTYVSYCFAEVKGFSKFGSYTGNGNADGPFIYTGFKPALFILKERNGTNSWQIFDNKRPGYNLTDKYLKPNESAAEVSGNNQIDMLTNGIKLRSSNTANNGSGQSFIYMAFAENPLVGTNNIPATAR